MKTKAPLILSLVILFFCLCPAVSVNAADASDQGIIQSTTSSIIDMQVDNSAMTASLSVNLTEDAFAVVALYDENTDAMLATGRVEATKGTESVDVPLTPLAGSTVPASFKAAAFLLASDTLDPISEEYTTLSYTTAFNNFYSKNAADYENQERVVTIDGGNYGVYQNTVIRLQQNEGTVSCVSNGGSSYTFSGDTAALSGITEGSLIAYEYADGQIALVKAASVSSSGSSVTVAQADASDFALTDFFDVLRIEAGPEDFTLTPAGSSNNKSSVGKEAKAAGGDKTLTVDIDFAEIDLESSDHTEITLSGGMEAEFTPNFEKYIYDGNEVTRFTLDETTHLDVVLEGTVRGMLYTKLELGCHIGPVQISYEPKFKVEANGSIEWDLLEMTARLGFERVNKKTKNLTEGFTPTKNTSMLKMKGDFGFYLDGGPSIALFEDDVDRIELEFYAGPCLEASTPDPTDEGVRHDCKVCVDGDISVKGGVEITVYLLNKKIDSFKVAPELSKKFWDFYICFDERHKHFALTECPYMSYRVKAKVTDIAGSSLEGVSILGTRLAKDPKSNVSGEAEFYLPSGKYDLSLNISSTPVHLEIDGAPREVTLSSDTLEGSCGPDLNFSLDKSTGVLEITGRGPMYDWEGSHYINGHLSQYDYPDWADYNKYIRTIIYPAGITSIGDHAALGGASLSGTLVIPEGVTKIGDYAFAGTKCTALELPDSLLEIGELAFEFSYDLSGTLRLPDHLEKIGYQAFLDCNFTGDLVIPDSCKEIGDAAFIRSISAGTPVDSDGQFHGGTLTLGSGLTHIGSGAFQYCGFVGSLELPQTLLSIESRAFEDCAGLTGTVRLPDSIKRVGSAPFSGTGLTIEMHIPRSIVDMDACFGGASVQGNTAIFPACMDRWVNTGTIFHEIDMDTVYFLGNCPGNSDSRPIFDKDDEVTIYYPSDAMWWSEATLKKMAPAGTYIAYDRSTIQIDEDDNVTFTVPPGKSGKDSQGAYNGAEIPDDEEAENGSTHDAAPEGDGSAEAGEEDGSAEAAAEGGSDEAGARDVSAETGVEDGSEETGEEGGSVEIGEEVDSEETGAEDGSEETGEEVGSDEDGSYGGGQNEGGSHEGSSYEGGSYEGSSYEGGSYEGGSYDAPDFEDGAGAGQGAGEAAGNGGISRKQDQAGRAEGDDMDSEQPDGYTQTSYSRVAPQVQMLTDATSKDEYAQTSYTQAAPQVQMLTDATSKDEYAQTSYTQAAPRVHMMTASAQGNNGTALIMTASAQGNNGTAQILTTSAQGRNGTALILPTSAQGSNGKSGIQLLSYSVTPSGDDGGRKTATVSNLSPGSEYVLIVHSDSVPAGNPAVLAPENLIYITQTEADASGSAAFSYVDGGREDVAMEAYGRSGSLANASVTVTNASSLVFNYGEVAPRLTVKLGSIPLTEGKDYYVVKKQVTNVGEGSVILKGMGSCIGQKRVAFEILPRAIGNAVVALDKTAFVYDGQVHKPTVTLYDYGPASERIDLVEGVDYTLENEGVKINQGTVTITGIGNYGGTSTRTYQVNETEHAYGAVTVTKESSNSSTGSYTKVCTVCGRKLNGTILKRPTVSSLTQGDGCITVSWGSVSNAGGGYEVFRKAGVGAFAKIGAVTRGTSYTDENVANGATYTYAINALPSATSTSYMASGIYEGQMSITYTGKTSGAGGSGGSGEGSGGSGDGSGGSGGAGDGSNGSQGGTAPGTGGSPGAADGSSGNGTAQNVTVKRPAIKSIKAPGKKRLTLKWKAVSGADGYQIQYSLKRTFKGKKSKRVKAGKKKTYALTLKKLKKKKYYVRIRAYKKVDGTVYYSKWSKIKYKKVK